MIGKTTEMIKMNNVYYTYLYRDENGTPIYVGKGKNKRAWTHLSSKSKHPFIYKLQKMILNGHNPQPEFLCKDVDEEFAFFAEEEAIAYYGRKDLKKGTLLNLTEGGFGTSGHKHSDAAKEKISIASKGKKRSPEFKEKIRKANLGLKKSVEFKQKLSIANKGKSLSEETKQKLRKPKSEETKQKLRKPKSEETKQKMRKPKSSDHKAKLQKNLDNVRIKKKVVTPDREFESAAAAARYYNVSGGAIWWRCKQITGQFKDWIVK